MAVNDIIKEADYNSIRNKIANVVGAGSANSGWGQTVISSAVGVGNTVSVNEWGRLRFDIINAYKHIFGTTPTTAQPALGNTVRYSNTFGPNNTTDAPVTQYDAYANTIVSNRFTVDPSQSATFSWPVTSTSWPGIYGNFWTAGLQCTATVSWPTAEAARFFFNSGGEIRFAAARVGGSTTQQCLAWTSLLSTVGTQAFGANKPGTGTSPANGQNWYRLTNTYQQWYSLASSTPYGGNSYRISARTPAVANNSAGTATTIEFLIEMIDNYIDPGNYPLDTPNTIDAVDGTFSVSVSHLYATGILEPTGTGNFTIVQPSINVGFVQTTNPPTPFWTVIPRASSVNEGSSVTFDISTNQISSGNLYVKLIGTYEGAGTTATVSILNGSGTYTVTPPADITTEGFESFQVELRSGSQTGTLVATSTPVVVNDTSTNPIPSFTALVVGGGGGGGGTFFNGQIVVSGGGGGSGGSQTSTFTGTSPGQVFSVSIGSAGGGSGYNSQSPGGTGGTSIFGAVQSTGGIGGQSYIFGGDQSPDGGAGGSPNGVAGNPGAFPSANGGAGGNNGSGFGSGGSGGQDFTAPGNPGQSGAVRITYPGNYTLSAINGLGFTTAFDGTNTTYTFTSGSGSITL
jgi:hypothetical protein